MIQQVKIAVCQFNPTVGALTANTNKLIQAIKQAKLNHAQVFISPELAICGYSAADLFFRPAFRIAVNHELERIKAITGITIIIGAPGWGAADSHKIFNSAYVFLDGVPLGRYDKQVLPNYGVFDEQRYFTPGHAPLVIECNQVKLGILICEDIWQPQPASLSAKANAQILCVLNASPFHTDKHAKRLQAVAARAKETNLPVVYVNQVCGEDELIFDGASFVLNADGSLACQMAAFTEQLCYVLFTPATHLHNYALTCYAEQVDCHSQWSDCHSQLDWESMPYSSADTASIYSALVLGIRDYVNKNGFSGVLIGLSGGIDSALTLTLAVDALGAKRVMAVMLPSQYTADMSIIDARELANTLQVRYEEISIDAVVSAFKQQLQPVFGVPAQGGAKSPSKADTEVNLLADTTDENLQARTRGTLLMALSNKLGYLLLATGNKSEMATGYATLYGDMAGGFAPLKDVLKTEVYMLANWRNLQHSALNTSQGRVIPERIITRAPTAELREEQTDQDTLPEYAVLDQILRLLIENKLSSQEIITRGFSAAIVHQVVRLMKASEHKRYQAALGPKISPCSFAKEWRYPLTNHFNY